MSPLWDEALLLAGPAGRAIHYRKTMRNMGAPEGPHMRESVPSSLLGSQELGWCLEQSRLH